MMDRREPRQAEGHASERVRLFLAVELPREIKEALDRIVTDVRGAGIRGLRAVNPEGIHLTLKFLGEVERSRIEHIVDEVRRVARAHQPFTLELEGLGGFPSRGAPRALWVGVTGDTEPMLALQRELEEALEPLGFSKERREFRPHLTFARVSERAPSADRRRASKIFEAIHLEPGFQIPVSGLSLMRSMLLPGGARYDRLAIMPFDADSGN